MGTSQKKEQDSSSTKNELSHDQTMKNAETAAIFIQELLDDFILGYGNY